jgi:hypothetical protein
LQLVLEQTSFEIARDRTANKGTHLAESRYVVEVTPTTTAVPLYRCVVELRPGDGLLGSYAPEQTFNGAVQKSASGK